MVLISCKNLFYICHVKTENEIWSQHIHAKIISTDMQKAKGMLLPG